MSRWIVLHAREDTGPPWAVWAVIPLTSALGTVIIYGVEKRAMHYSMVTIVASSLFLELSHSYVGKVATSSDPLAEVVRVPTRPAE